MLKITKIERMYPVVIVKKDKTRTTRYMTREQVKEAMDIYDGVTVNIKNGKETDYVLYE